MPTECSARASEFTRVGGRPVIAEFDGGALTSDAGGLLLGATDKALGLIDRLSKCFRDARHPELIEHTVATLVGQRVFGIALGYEDLNDHDELRHDPLMAVLAGKLEARRADCAPVAGKSTLNRLELSVDRLTKYRKIAHDAAAIERLYCARGEMENRIKECQGDLFADRTSAATMRANQLRLWFASFAYVLLCAVRRIACPHAIRRGDPRHDRLKLLKLGALVKVSARRIKFSLASACPYANEWRLAAAGLALDRSA